MYTWSYATKIYIHGALVSFEVGEVVTLCIHIDYMADEQADTLLYKVIKGDASLYEYVYMVIRR